MMRTEETTCCVVGGGPAGMMAALLLARQGVKVTVLEKHEDFLRDFRGDTIHPATLQVLDELGALEQFLALPHTRMEKVTMDTPSGPVTFADFTKAGRHGYIAFVPQWDFLDFLADWARRYPSFHLLTRAEVTDLVEEDGRVVGVRATTPDGALEVRATLVLAADGRHSTVRGRAGLEVLAKSAPMDVLWFRISRRPDDHAFRTAVAAAAPPLADRVDEINDWEAVKLLSVRVDRLRRWYRSGMLCIGDAAHAMSPAGGVGINLAIQDAVAAANILGPTFRSGGPTLRDLRRVQRRREWPTRMVQAFQVKVLRDLYPNDGGPRAETVRGPATEGGYRDPVALRLLRAVPTLRHLAGRFIGQGIRPEHVRVGTG